MNLTTVYFLKSDNYNCWVTEAAYHKITMEMSTGDWHNHKLRRVDLDANQLENLRYHSRKGLVDLIDAESACAMGWDNTDTWAYYSGDGDVNFEPSYT